MEQLAEIGRKDPGMFCFLEKDEKTFDYMQIYLDAIRKEGEPDLVKIDNSIQEKEIVQHMATNGISQSDNEQKILWIIQYGSSFRTYLNTLKLAAAFWYFYNETTEFTWDAFCIYIEKINKYHRWLDALHN
jgi:hypothetical protein